MLKYFLNLWPAIKLVINLSDSKSFKKNKAILLLTNIEIAYLERCLKIFFIFIKATTKLQAERYPTIYYIIPKVYSIYTRLENIKTEFNISLIPPYLSIYTNSFINSRIYKSYRSRY